MVRRAKIIDKDRGWLRVKREIAAAKRRPHVAVGIFGSKAAEDHGGIPTIKVGFTHEFGATIWHPGGTAYFINPEGQAVFVSNEAAAGLDLPRTKPHRIVIPERSFIRGTVDARRRAIAKFVKTLATAVIEGRMMTPQALERLGIFVQGEIRKRISAGIPPPLKAATIKRKGSSKPLIATGQLRASIDYQVRKGK